MLTSSIGHSVRPFAELLDNGAQKLTGVTRVLDMGIEVPVELMKPNQVSG